MKEEELRDLVQHSVILALPGCAPAVELRSNSLSMIRRGVAPEVPKFL